MRKIKSFGTKSRPLAVMKHIFSTLNIRIKICRIESTI